ncbi:uncharacterized protein TNCV_4697561 [Trichonephila clavipes]|nr:uncharacterized protein TNCV_4697561 [Trichonephila clavipes]
MSDGGRGVSRNGNAELLQGHLGRRLFCERFSAFTSPMPSSTIFYYKRAQEKDVQVERHPLFQKKVDQKGGTADEKIILPFVPEKQVILLPHNTSDLKHRGQNRNRFSPPFRSLLLFHSQIRRIWAQNEIAVVPDFHKRILFSDEAQFWLNGYVNKQNCRIWSEANPQVYVETPLHPEKLTVWCALWADGIIGPYFFKNE